MQVIKEINLLGLQNLLTIRYLQFCLPASTFLLELGFLGLKDGRMLLSCVLSTL